MERGTEGGVEAHGDDGVREGVEVVAEQARGVLRVAVRPHARGVAVSAA